MKSHRFTAMVFSLVLLGHWHPPQHGLCSEQTKPDPQNQPQTTQDITEQLDEPIEKQGNDAEDSVAALVLHTPEHRDQTDTASVDELHTKETGQKEEKTTKDLQVDGTTSESGLTSEDSEAEPHADQTGPEPFIPQRQITDLSPLPALTSSNPLPIPEDLSSITTALPGPASCSLGDGSCTSTALSATAACEAEDSPPYDVDLESSGLPMVLENTTGSGKGTKTSLHQGKKGTNASSMPKESVHVTPETDPTAPSKEPEDIPTFDEWKKKMMEVENEKSQTTHTSCNGGSSTVKKVQKTTNYASVECGAKILSSNPEAKSTSAILMENMDMYMLNPCSNKIWFIIELCQPIQVKQLDIANFELFSSTPKDFLVSISDRYPTNKWAKLGTFHARDERTVQSFPLDEHLYAKYVKMFTKYIKVELLSHFGSEHFCPLSLIRVFGTSMMEEYELNSEPSERLNFEDEDYDYPPGYLPSDDKSSKNLIGSAKDVIINMVNNIAANVLGGNPDDVARTGGNYSSLNLNLTETSGAPPTISPTTSYIVSETFEQEQHESNAITKTVAITQDTTSDVEDQTVPLPTTSLTETPSATLSTPESLAPTPPDKEQIVTLLPKEDGDFDDLDQSKSSSTSNLPQEEEQSVKADLDQKNTLKINCYKQSLDSCSCSCTDSLEEYLLQTCRPLPSFQTKKSQETIITTSQMLQESKSPIKTSQETQTTVTNPAITPSLTQTPQTQTLEIPSSVLEDSTTQVLVPPLPGSKNIPKAEVGSLELEPSLTSALPKPSATDHLASRATHAVDFIDLPVRKPPEVTLQFPEKTKEKPVEVKKTPVLTSQVESAPTPTLVLKTESEEADHDQVPTPTVEKSTTAKESLTLSGVSGADEQVPVTPLSTPIYQSIPQPTKTRTEAPAGTLTAAPVTEPLEGTAGAAEPKAEELFEEAVLGSHGSNGQSGQPSSTDFYAELPSSTDAPIHGSNQKESVFMRLNNRIKVLEVNMSLSGRYLEQLSQRYRKQMEEMQKAFNKTIIKLQNTSRIAEEQDLKQTESIQVLQGQLENITQLVLNLSLRVSQLQSEVSDRYIYLLLCVVLCFLLTLTVCINFCRMPAETPSSEPDSAVAKSYSYCCPESVSFGYEDVSLKRRASYPLSQSSLQIPTTEGPNEAYNVETQRNTAGHKKKKRCKMKSNIKPETLTPATLPVSTIPNGTPQCNSLSLQGLDSKLACGGPAPSLFTFRDPPSEGSSEASSHSDEPSFCGISTCNRLCEDLPPSKSRSEKRAFKRRRSRPNCTVVQQLLQPVQSSSPPVRPGPIQGFIKTTTELSAGRVGVTTISGLT